jgi:hypothetical protein
MDIIMVTGRFGDDYLLNQPVRILAMEEDDNGDISFECEQIQVGIAAPTS